MILLTHYHDGAKTFRDLGEEVMLIDRDACKEKFNDTLEKWFGSSLPKHREDTYAFVTWASGSKQEPLYKDFSYYLLANSGEVIRVLR